MIHSNLGNVNSKKYQNFCSKILNPKKQKKMTTALISGKRLGPEKQLLSRTPQKRHRTSQHFAQVFKICNSLEILQEQNTKALTFPCELFEEWLKRILSFYLPNSNGCGKKRKRKMMWNLWENRGNLWELWREIENSTQPIQ